MPRSPPRPTCTSRLRWTSAVCASRCISLFTLAFFRTVKQLLLGSQHWRRPLLALGLRQTNWTSLLLSIVGTDRQTDGRTADRFIDAHGQRQCTDRETLQKRKFLYSAKHRITLRNVVLLRYYRYDTTRDAILTCARKPTRVSLIYCTEPTTKKCKKQKKN